MKTKKEYLPDFIGNFIVKSYRISFQYIKESRKFIYFATGIFLFFSLVGFFVPFPESFKMEILNYLIKLVNETEGYSLMEMILFLFNNNSISSFFGLFLGFFFGIFPFFNALINGLLLGIVANFSVSEVGVFSLWRLFPHGIFELPAIFLSLGLGLKLSTFILKEKKGEALKEFLEKSLYVYFFVVLPLLVIAAIIEGILIIYL
ncbi:MAG: stage II sporulation protein M [Nanoarchaeota archaeon]|nr:stage II sporulation protein M [Nanoarchaeota archaeon]